MGMRKSRSDMVLHICMCISLSNLRVLHELSIMPNATGMLSRFILFSFSCSIAVMPPIGYCTFLYMGRLPLHGLPYTMGVPSGDILITGLSSLMRVLPGMCFVHRSLCVLLPRPLAPRNIYALPLFSTTDECTSSVLCGAVHIVYITMMELLSPNSMFCALPRVAMVNSLYPASLFIKAQGILFSSDTSMRYAPSVSLYTSNVAEGHGKVPILFPSHVGMMLLSMVRSNSVSSPLSVTNGFRLVSISGMFASAVMENACLATLK